MSSRPGPFISIHIDDLGPQGQSDGSDGAAVPTTKATNEVEKSASSGFRDSRSLQSAKTEAGLLLTCCDGERMVTASGPPLASPSLLEEQSQISTLGLVPAGVSASLRYSPDQSALIDIAKEHGALGLTCADGAVLKQWASEYGLPFRGPEVHPGRPFGRRPHLHVGPVDHIPVNDYG